MTVFFAAMLIVLLYVGAAWLFLYFQRNPHMWQRYRRKLFQLLYLVAPTYSLRARKWFAPKLWAVLFGGNYRGGWHPGLKRHVQRFQRGNWHKCGYTLGEWVTDACRWPFRRPAPTTVRSGIRRIRKMEALSMAEAENCQEEQKAIPEDKLCFTCKKREGRQRIDNGLAAGCHCDECWNKMLFECRSRSW